VSGQALAEAILAAGHKNVVFRSSMQEGIEELLRAAKPGDAILTIGAGNVSRAPGELAILLGARVSLHHED
jgi:UDP-N-acetylmuramate--alanine ligase